MRRVGGLSVVLMAMLLLVACVGGSGPPDRNLVIAVPRLFPQPRSVSARGPAVVFGMRAGLVTGAGSDPAAVAAVRGVLRAAGVSRIDEVTDLDALPAGEPAILLGQRAALRSLGVPSAVSLPAEGYVLASGRVSGRGVVVIDGHDGAGSFYGAQTLAQLWTTTTIGAAVPGVVVRDWPTLPVRGVIEGFYGVPWTQQARLDELDFLGRHKLNTYVYSPKDDPYLRNRWRDSYPSAQLAQLRALVRRAADNHVSFVYALSPGLSICYSSARDAATLVAKLQSVRDIGVRAFAIPLDDIDISTANCPADTARFGTGDAAAAAAQSFLLNRVQQDFIATHPGVARLAMVPTEYADTAASPYKNTLKAKLDPAIVVEWTGVGVIAPTISAADVAAAHAAYGHDILVWDNYPVNDYIPDRLLLGPYTGRQGALTGLAGLTVNPMPQAVASRIAEFTTADYLWNSADYQPARSWQGALDEMSGGDSANAAALAAFADLEYDSALDPTPAPALSARITAFWSAWHAGDVGAAAILDDYLGVIEGAPGQLAAHLPDREFVTEAQPWLASAQAWARAARLALRLLDDRRRGDRTAALADNHEIDLLVTRAGSFTYTGLGPPVPVLAGRGVIDGFVAAAQSIADEWLNPGTPAPVALTSLHPYQDDTAPLMVDGRENTFFSSDAAPDPGDFVGVDLGVPRSISRIWIDMATGDSPSDFVQAGVVEYSTDGQTWQTAATVQNSPAVRVALSPRVTARYVRLRVTASQQFWVAVREFSVH
jgi:hyaluronoglucosaminidase